MELSKKTNYLLFALVLVLAGIPIYENFSTILFKHNVVQDDARQVISLLINYWEPDAYGSHNDFFAQFYAPAQNKTLIPFIYKILSFFTPTIVFANKLLAILVALASSLFAYLYTRELFAKNSIAIAFSSVFATLIWCGDDVASGTSRSFAFLCLFAYLYFRKKEQQKIITLVQVLSIFLYPPIYLILIVSEGLIWLINRKKDILVSLAISSLPLIIFYLIPKLFFAADFEMLSADELKSLPHLQPGGRHPVFGLSPSSTEYWLSEHWGLGIFSPGRVYVTALGFISLAIYTLSKLFNKSINLSSFKFSELIQNDIEIKALAIASIGLYIDAQILFPLLYYPSRYVMTSLLIIALIYLFKLVNLLSSKTNQKTQIAIAAIITILGFGYLRQYYAANFHTIPQEVVDNIRKIPADSLIAIMPTNDISSTIPITTGRAVFVDHERAYFGSQEYLDEMSRRHKEVFEIFYSNSSNEILEIAKRNNISHLILSRDAYMAYFVYDPKYFKPYDQLLKEAIRGAKGIIFAKIFAELAKDTLDTDNILLSLEDVYTVGKVMSSE